MRAWHQPQASWARKGRQLACAPMVFQQGRSRPRPQFPIPLLYQSRSMVANLNQNIFSNHGHYPTCSRQSGVLMLFYDQGPLETWIFGFWKKPSMWCVWEIFLYSPVRARLDNVQSVGTPWLFATTSSFCSSVITVTDVRSPITSSQKSALISVKDPEQIGNSLVWNVILWRAGIVGKSFLQVRIASLHSYQRLQREN